MKKKHIVLLSVLAVVLIMIITGIVYVTGFSSRIASITVSDVNMSQIADGTYDGSYDMFPVSVAVKVTVKDHVITDIELIKHINGQGSGAEVLPGKVIEAQSLHVDTVSDATISSKVILKAIENALQSAGK